MDRLLCVMRHVVAHVQPVTVHSNRCQYGCLLHDFGLRSCVLLACCAGYQHPVDVVVSDLVSCLEDYTLPLMQFSEAFAVVQVRELPPLEEVLLLLSKYSTSMQIISLLQLCRCFSMYALVSSFPGDLQLF